MMIPIFMPFLKKVEGVHYCPDTEDTPSPQNTPLRGRCFEYRSLQETT